VFFQGQGSLTNNKLSLLEVEGERRKCLRIVGTPPKLIHLSTDLFTGGNMIVLELWEIVLFSIVLAICIGLYFDN
jgi:hypothetical protein